MALKVFLDTNILLHFRTFNEIGWASVLKDSPIELVFPAIVIREIDKKKLDAPTRKIRDRARTVITLFKRVGQDGRFSVGGETITVRFLSDEPKIDWQANQLDPSLNDDRIIGSILDVSIAEHLSLDSVRLISNDFGLQLKAQSRGIKVTELNESFALDLSSDATDVELRKAKEELGKLRKQFPKLSLKFAGTSPPHDQLKVQLVRQSAPPTDGAVSHKVEEVEKSLIGAVPSADTRDFKKHIFGDAMKLVAVSPERIQEYKEAIRKYVQEYPTFLRQEYESQCRLARTVKLIFALVNSGSAPAEDSDIFLHFPDGFVLTDKEPLPYEIPDPPKPPRHMFEELQQSMLLASTIPYVSNGARNIAPTAPNVSTPKITHTKSYEVRVKVRRIKHTMEIQLDPMWVIFADHKSCTSFTITYSLLAANYPEAFQGELHVIIDKI